MRWRQRRDRPQGPPPPAWPHLKESIRHKTEGVVKKIVNIKCKLVAAGPVFSTVVNITRDAADVCPPLKSVTGLLASGIEHTKRTKDVRVDAQALLDRVTTVQATLDACDSLSSEIRRSGDALRTLCHRCIQSARPMVKASFKSRLLHLPRDEALIKSLGRELDQALDNFRVVSAIQTQRQLVELAQVTDDTRVVISEFRQEFRASATQMERTTHEVTQACINVRQEITLWAAHNRAEVRELISNHINARAPPVLTPVLEADKISPDRMRALGITVGTTVSVVLF